ncbi:hypothetical protein HC752_17695 [Vibrio sp. S9_S30]|uniref:hypothetical protein n=1 Tax=Vibrio sp. S9_S30 TaxID=2720226 RepID=UPI0016811242|nr:hypothetical protein [Vibrio sp. S9_S30]MBD1558768.1 hypothetical protein [Vibrio sp. S9_S30]
MTKRSCKWICMLGFFTVPAFACTPFQTPTSIMMVKKERDSVCASIVRSFDVLTSSLTSVREFIIDPVSDDNYWKEWTLKSGSDPLLYSSVESNYFGVGFWMPDEYESQFDDMTYSEKLQAAGLKFSLGLGERNDNEPRIRIDYRWHNQQPGDVTLQLEVPF